MRQRLGRPMGWPRKSSWRILMIPPAPTSSRGKSYVQLRPDRVILQDVLGQTAMLQFMQTRRTQTAVPTSVHCDHLIQARVEGESDQGVASREPRGGTTFCAPLQPSTAWASGGQVPASFTRWRWRTTRFRRADDGTDSHTPMAGGQGSCAVGVGGADAVEVMAGLPWEVLFPRFIGVYLTGEMSAGQPRKT